MAKRRRRERPRQAPVVEVVWVDSVSTWGWVPRSEVRGGLSSRMTCHSVGFLVGRSKDRIVITAGISGSDNLDCPMVIPRVAIRSMRRIEMGGKPSKGTPKDGRLSANKPKPAGGKTVPKGGKRS